MKKSDTSGAVTIFIGALLTVCFVIGLIYSKNPGAFIQSHRMDYAFEGFVSLCGEWFIPCGGIGIPMLVISLIVCLVKERRNK